MTAALFATTVDITLEAFLLPFADHLRARGWRVDALSRGATENDCIAEHFNERFDVPWSRNALAPSNLTTARARVRKIVEAGQYDLVHVHTPVASFATRLAVRGIPEERRPKVIYTAHGFHFYEGQSALPHALFRTMERMAAPWTDYLVTINEQDFEAARKFGSIPAERVRLIPGIGVDTEHYRPDAVSPARIETLRAELGIAPDAFVVAMVAEMAPVKRHEHALAAWEAAHSARESGAVLVLVGDGPLRAELERSVDARALSESVRFAGYRRDVPAVLAASDALLLCSEREGLNRSVLEAMASGKPVIGTDTRGIGDAIGSPECGWIAPKSDAAALARALDEAASDRDDTSRRGRAARMRAVSRFGIDRILAEYDALYEEALIHA